MTITPENVQAAVRAGIEAAFPGEPVYESVTPRGFQRPCSLLEMTGIDLDPLSMGQGAVTLRCHYKLTTFCQVDELHHSHLPVLNLRAMGLLAAFAAGYVRVGDRAMKVARCTADTRMYDAAEVALSLELAVDRTQFAPEEIYPIMRVCSMKIHCPPH